MKSFHQKLRASGLLRPAQEHPQQTGWRNDTDCDWHSGKNPAIVSANTEKLRKSKPVKAAKVTPKPQCKSEDCTQDANKSGYCNECLHEIRREKKRLYRAKKRAEFKVEKTCRVCGDPRLPNKTVCRAHYNEYQRKQRAKYNAPIQAQNEAHQSKRTSLLEQRWQKIQEEYANGQR